VQDEIDYSFRDKSGRIVLITIVINFLMLSLCNIYAPNNQGEQLEFLQELNNCLIDKSELMNYTRAFGTKYVLPVCALEKVWELTKKFLQISHLVLSHLKQPANGTAVD